MLIDPGKKKEHRWEKSLWVISKNNSLGLSLTNIKPSESPENFFRAFLF
jgi:hypothetical protein